MSGENLALFDAYMRTALHAQSQGRATLETLVTIKNPPVVIAKQANVTTGPQQVNNGIASHSPAREIETAQSKLLEAEYGERLDSRAQSAAIGSDPALASMGTVDRAEVTRR